MKTFVMILTSLTIATSVWAGHMQDGKAHPGIMFEKMDTNKDGSVSTQEHEAGLQRMQERHREHFNKMDTDGDGMVTREEAKTARANMDEKLREHRRECKQESN